MTTETIPENQFERLDIEAIREMKRKADIKADILRAFNNESVDDAFEALKKANHYLLNIDNETGGRKKWLERKFVEKDHIEEVKRVLSNVFSDKRSYVEFYLTPADRIFVGKGHGKEYGKYQDKYIQCLMTGPPQPKVQARWDQVEIAYAMIYGEEKTANPEKPQIPENILKQLEEK